MTKEELNEIFKDVDESKKKVVQTMFDDFIYEINQINLLKPQIESIGIPRSKTEAEKKKYLLKEYGDLSQRHDSKIKIFLSTLGKFEGEDEDDFIKFRNSLGSTSK